VTFFDHGAFRLTAAEATLMDPQQRLALEEGYAALAPAGFTLDGGPTGAVAVVAAIGYAEYLPKPGIFSSDGRNITSQVSGVCFFT